MALFDLRWGYHLRYSSAAGVYFNGPKPDRLRRPQYSKPWARKARKPRRRLLATAVSNCNDYAGRAQYLGALRAALGEEFVNIGRCHHSLSAEDKAELERAGADKFIARGYFYLALENANCDGYVTEKLGRAMLAGVVPVVFDAPQSLAGGADATALPGYAPFLPPGTYVNVADHATPADLAAHLRRVAANRTLYNAYLWPRGLTEAELIARWPGHAQWARAAWRAPRADAGPDAGPLEAKEAAAAAAPPPPAELERNECSLARAALARLASAERSGQRPPRLAPDQSCLPPGQLCHFLPAGVCKAGGVEQRIRPEVRRWPAHGKRPRRQSQSVVSR